MLTTAEIRSKFLAFFKEKLHTVLPSSSLVPSQDPTLLFTNAGMVQFKTIFQGKELPSVSTVATVQKCIRAGGKHNDLDNVGRTARHHTFFEMLGNFSFGAYFKKEAIRYAWEFITEELHIDKSKLYVTVFLDDDEAYALWQSECSLPENRIFRLGEKDNFWSMGDTGPCGPCSEIFVDQGEHLSCGESCGIGRCDCDRFLEIWNLVFMQFDALADGTRVPLPHPSIDTGSGLERLSAVCQQVYSNYDIDIFRDIISYIVSLTQGKYQYTQSNSESDVALRVIADHSRAIAFMIADGILPSNEGRGYVLRRILRRAYRFGRELGFEGEFLFNIVLFVAKTMGTTYPELLVDTSFMEQIVKKEEEAFNKTLDKGLILLQEILDTAKRKNHTYFCGKKAFVLHDTYGFPIDIVSDIVEKEGLQVDLAEFEACIQEQKERARLAWKGGNSTVIQDIFTQLSNMPSSQFIGYEDYHIQSHIQALYSKEGLPVESLHEGEHGYCILDKTPFYATAGGQESDTGSLLTPNALVECLGAEVSPSGVIIHSIYVTSGEIKNNTSAEAHINIENRLSTARNHTATHLAFSALRSCISPNIRQAGSLVTAEKLRFDYTSMQALTPEEIICIENKVNSKIQEAISADVVEQEYHTAIEEGAISLVGESYDDTVRVVTFGEYSKELCCGTHVTNTGEIGAFVIISDTGLATGIRRIEAVTGMNALRYLQEQRKTLSHIALQLKCPQATIQKQIDVILEEKKSLQKQIEEQQSLLAQYIASSLTEKKEEVAKGSLLTQNIPHASPQLLKAIIDNIRPSFTNGVILLTTTTEEHIHCVIYTGKDIMQHYTAKDILEAIAPYIDAKGGGKPDLVQAGGKRPRGIDEAYSVLRTLLS